jgi:membrane protein YdbS with pleckstrin-like domain
MEYEQPLLTLRPKFLSIATLLSLIPIQLFLTIWAGLFCGGFVSFPLQVIPFLQQQPEGTEVPPEFLLTCLGPIGFFALLAFFGVPIIGYLSKKRRYAMTEYRFFPTSLEYYEGFFTVERKTIDYRVITEIIVRKGPVQRMYGLGSLVLSTAATSTGSGASRSGIVLADLESPEKLYHQVRGFMSRRPNV